MIILKSDAEIEKLRISNRIDAQILDQLGRQIRPGIKTMDLEEYAEGLMKKMHCTPAFKGYAGYPASICVSPNDIIVHGIPGNRRLKEGDIVSIDVGVIKDGYYGDTAATFGVGRISAEADRLMQVTKNALMEGIRYAKTGNCLGSISWAVQRVVEDAGFSVVRDFVGHGIGQNLHEDPQIPNFGNPEDGPLLRHGMVIAIEPMVNEGTYKTTIDKDGWTARTKDRRLAAHFEHTIAVLDTGPEILSVSK